MGTPGDQPNIYRLPEIKSQLNPPSTTTLTPTIDTHQLSYTTTNMPNILSPLQTLGSDLSLLKHELEPSITDLAPSLAELEPSITELDIDRIEPSVNVIDIRPGPSGLQGRSGNGKRGGNGTGRKVPGGYQCGHCHKVFPNPSKLFKHQTIHSSAIAPFKCEHCKKAFSSKFKLVRHALIHSDRRPFCCTVCNRTFHRKDHLKNHCKVHDHSKELYICGKTDCKKEYTSHLSYKKHLALHAAEEGNLNCQLCLKNFKTKDEVLMHLKVHAGSRPVKNPDEKKYRCDSCDRRFFTRKDVRRHEVVHTGMRDFLCQFCPERFGRKDHLIRHIKKLHYQQQEVQQSATSIDQLRSSCTLTDATVTPSTSTSSIPTIKLETSETDFYDTSMDFLLGSTGVADDDDSGFTGIAVSSDSVAFKDEPLEDLGSNVLEDIASGSQAETELTELDLGDTPSVGNEFMEMLEIPQQTGKLPAFAQIFQPQQMQKEPPD